MACLNAVELYRFFHAGGLETVALKEVSLTLGEGELVALVGPSGSGKSTLLSCLAGIDEPDGGTVDVMGERMSHRPEAIRSRLRARHVGMLLQTGNLFEHLTVRRNVMLQQHLSRSGANIAALLASVGLADRAGSRPGQLSGGEAARAGLCVALAAAPAVLLCDEPTAELDRDNEAEIVGLLKHLRQSGTAILVATHSTWLAAEADRIVTMRDGRLT
jgi:putative ABC transport system ATP-binding protein